MATWQTEPPAPSNAHILAVRNTLSAYCMHLDSKAYAKLHDIFAPDCVADYGAVAPSVAGAADLSGPAAIVDFVRDRTLHKTTVHSLATQTLRFGGDLKSCDATTYFTANTFGPLPSGPGEALDHVMVLGRYEDVLVLGPQVSEKVEWVIAKRKVFLMVPRIQQRTELAESH